MPRKAAKLVRTHGMRLSGYCRGGMFPAADEAGRLRAREDNRRALDEALTHCPPAVSEYVVRHW